MPYLLVLIPHDTRQNERRGGFEMPTGGCFHGIACIALYFLERLIFTPFLGIDYSEVSLLEQFDMGVWLSGCLS